MSKASNNGGEQGNNNASSMVFNDGVALNKTHASESLLAPIPGQNSTIEPNENPYLNKPQAKLLPMSPLAASVTVVNLVLATGPFSYPQQFANLGPVLSLILLFVTAFISYITSTFIVEVIASANCVSQSENRTGTLFPDSAYRTPELMRSYNLKDDNYKDSKFYIREKVELGKMVERFCAPWIKVVMMTILVIYMYGAMCLKYASGAASFVSAVSYMMYSDADQWKKEWLHFDPYYLGIIIFGVLSLFFCFGNIENSKYLQIFTGVFRLVVIICLYGATSYYLVTGGVHAAPVFNWSEQLSHIANVFGGTVFVFIFHHSISGIVYPIRPQKDIKPMFLTSHILGASLLAIEGMLAYLAFSGLENDCSQHVYPCKIEDLFNKNFVNIPIIGPLCNFYPMLNVSSVPVLTITLRNNLMQVLPIKQWLSKYNNRVCKLLLQDDRRLVKGIWAIIISIPVIIIVLFFQKPQVFITYTGGICGTFILFIVPVTLVFHARKKQLEKTYGLNFNKSPFDNIFYIYLVIIYALFTLAAVITGLIIAKPTGH